MSGGHHLFGPRIIRYHRVESHIAIQLILNAAVTFDIDSQLTQVFRLVVRVSDRRTIEVLGFVHRAGLPRADDRAVLGEGLDLHRGHQQRRRAAGR